MHQKKIENIFQKNVLSLLSIWIFILFENKQQKGQKGHKIWKDGSMAWIKIYLNGYEIRGEIYQWYKFYCMNNYLGLSPKNIWGTIPVLTQY
jgi:hypothetical protein